MKKSVLVIMLAAVFMGCSKDDDKSNCESCKADDGTKIEICDNEDGTYTITIGGKKTTISEGELEGFPPEEFIEAFCKDYEPKIL